MKPRNWLIGVSHIGMVLVLELWFSARSSSQASSHSVNGLPLAAALLTVAAGYRVSGFVHWHKVPVGASRYQECLESRHFEVTRTFHVLSRAFGGACSQANRETPWGRVYSAPWRE